MARPVEVFGMWLVAAVLLLAPGAGLADTEIASVDQRYDVATKYFGDGEVQMHSRFQTDQGPMHEVHHFNCTDLTYVTQYTGLTSPAAFPIAQGEANIASFDQTHEIAPLAQHACTKHGHPLLEW